jgi:hypothetical protein
MAGDQSGVRCGLQRRPLDAATRQNMRATIRERAACVRHRIGDCGPRTSDAP